MNRDAALAKALRQAGHGIVSLGSAIGAIGNGDDPVFVREDLDQARERLLSATRSLDEAIKLTKGAPA